MSRKKALLFAQVALTAVVLGLAGRSIATYWRDFRTQSVGLDLEWKWILASGTLFLLAYVILVQTWRAILSAWGSHVGFRNAAHIFAVSSLARYIPGKLWQIGAMGVMAQRAGASPVAAAGSAVISTVANIATGLIVVLATGWSLVDLTYRGASRVGLVLIGAAAAGLLAAPWVLPRLLGLIRRATGRDLSMDALPWRALMYAGVGNVLAWMFYGVAFQLLTRGILGAAVGSMTSYIAVYTLSYVFGYLMLFAPAGVGFREAAMIIVMPASGLATVGQASVMAIGSRLWLTVLETVPGLLFLMLRSMGGPPATSRSSDAKV